MDQPGHHAIYKESKYPWRCKKLKSVFARTPSNPKTLEEDCRGKWGTVFSLIGTRQGTGWGIKRAQTKEMKAEHILVIDAC
jgi:hypothetical protein